MKPKDAFWRVAATTIAIAPFLSGCGASLSDFSLKDQEWFTRAPRVFNRTVSIESPPLRPSAPVAPTDLINSDGSCAGTNATQANALAQSQPAPTGTIALGHTECDVERAAGAPSDVNISANAAGERVVTLTYRQGPRPGIYRFTDGRLTEVEAVAPPPASAKPVKKKKTTPPVSSAPAGSG